MNRLDSRTRSQALQPSALHVTVSGSFRKAVRGVQDAVTELSDLGATVLSPADPRIVDQFGDFVFIASDWVRRIRTVQARHLAAIAASDFLWLVSPDGYVGSSASMEIGFAAAKEIPVFCQDVPQDLTLRQWVKVVPGPRGAIVALQRLTDTASRAPHDTVLLDPVDGLEAVHDDLVIAQRGLTGRPTEPESAAAEFALSRARARLTVP